MLLYEIMFKEVPFRGEVDKTLGMKIVRGYKPDQEVQLDPPYDELDVFNNIFYRKLWY